MDGACVIFSKKEIPMQAIWKGAVIADSDDTVIVEGNHYFSPEALKREFFRPSPHHSTCP